MVLQQIVRSFDLLIPQLTLSHQSDWKFLIRVYTSGQLTSLFTNLLWPGESERTFRSLNENCHLPTTLGVVFAVTLSLFIAGCQAGKL